MQDLLYRPLAEVLARLIKREFSAVELMQATLARIEETRQELNAFSALRNREEILADARAADARFASGEVRPLEGIGLGVKDLEDAAGLVTSYGSVPFNDNLAARD